MERGTVRVKRGLAEMLKGGVIMDVTNAEQAKIAETAGAVSVMALERVPADIRAEGGVARMADLRKIDTTRQLFIVNLIARLNAQVLQHIFFKCHLPSCGNGQGGHSTLLVTLYNASTVMQNYITVNNCRFKHHLPHLRGKILLMAIFACKMKSYFIFRADYSCHVNLHPLVSETSYLTLHYRLSSHDDNNIVSTFDDRPRTIQLGVGQLAPFGSLPNRFVGRVTSTI